ARCALPERRGPRRTVPCLLCARPVTAAPQPTTGRSQCTRPAGSSLRARTARIFAACRPSLLHRVLVLDVLAPRLGRTTFVLLVLLLGLVEAFRKPLQVLGHRPHEQHHSDQEQQHHDQAERGGLAELFIAWCVVASRLLREHQAHRGCHPGGRLRQERHAVSFGMPANRSSSGSVVSTSECTSSYSSVGQSSRSSSTGTANQRESGSICVACAFSASSRTLKQSAHSTRVATRSITSGRFESQRLSQASYGDSWPRARRASWKVTILERENPCE